MVATARIIVRITRLSTGRMSRRYQIAAVVGDLVPDKADRDWPTYESAKLAAEDQGFEVITFASAQFANIRATHHGGTRT